MSRQKTNTSVTSNSGGMIYILSGFQLGLAPGSCAAGNGRKLTALLTAAHHQDLPTGWARRMGSQPRVNASHVEAMPALRQYPYLFPFREISQTDGALRRHLRRVSGGAGVGELGKGLQHLLLQAFVGRGLSRRSGASPAGGAPAKPSAAGHGN